MSSVSDNYDAPWEGEPTRVVRWWSWPLRERPLRGLLWLVCLIAAGFLVQYVTGKIHLTFLAVTVLLIALWRFVIPVLFELNSDGISLWIFGHLRHIPWTQIAQVTVDGKGVFLSPHKQVAAIDAVRGLYLPWGKRRDEVLARLDYYLESPENDRPSPLP